MSIEEGRIAWNKAHKAYEDASNALSRATYQYGYIANYITNPPQELIEALAEEELAREALVQATITLMKTY